MAEKLMNLVCPRCGGEGRTSKEEDETRKVWIEGRNRRCPECNYVWEWRAGMPLAEGEREPK